MEYFLKENKKFVIAVGAGLLVALLYNVFVLGPLGRSAAAAKKGLETERGVLKARMANGVPSPESLRSATVARDRAKQTLSTLVTETSFKAPDKFRRPERVSGKSHFEDLKLNLYTDLHQKAVNGKIAFPATLGMGDSVTDEEAPEFLLRLAVVERLAQAAIDAEIGKIEAIDGLAGVGSREEGGGTKKAAYLTKHGVFMKFSGKAESVFKVLHAVQRKGQYLAVTNFEALRDDGTKDLFVASISVAMLKVDEKGALEVR